jgi:inhibitor of cysteine peptidase
MAQAVAIFTEADNGKSVELRVGDSVALRLYENAATGYRWSFEQLDPAAVDAREDGYTRQSDAIGSGGDMQWTLEAKAPATTQVKLKLWRSWEGDASVQKRFALTLRIRP